MLKAIRNLDYMVILCDDLDRMKHFYHTVMGFPIYRDWGEWIELAVGATLLTLRRRGRPYDGARVPGAASFQLAFRVSPRELESCYAELVEKNVELIEGIRDQGYGHMTLFFKDPEGNVLEIYADI